MVHQPHHRHHPHFQEQVLRTERTEYPGTSPPLTPQPSSPGNRFHNVIEGLRNCWLKESRFGKMMAISTVVACRLQGCSDLRKCPVRIIPITKNYLVVFK